MYQTKASQWCVWALSEMLRLSIKTLAYTINSPVYAGPAIYRWCNESYANRVLLLEQADQLKRLEESIRELRERIEENS